MTKAAKGKKKTDKSLLWLKAIHDATRCLRDQLRVSFDGKFKDSLSVEHEIKHSLHFLEKLQKELVCKLPTQKNVTKLWDQAPSNSPPEYHYKPPMPRVKKKKQSKLILDKQWSSSGHRLLLDTNSFSTAPELLTTSDPSHWNKSSSYNNRYAAFLEEEEEEEEDMPEEREGTTEERDAAADEREDAMNAVFCGVPWQPSASAPAPVSCHRLDAQTKQGPAYNIPMSIRRIMIRIYTAQSELYAHMANRYRRSREWALGATMCHQSLIKIQAGLSLTESELTHGGPCHMIDSSSPHAREQLLLEDASIVEVAVKSLYTAHREFTQKVRQQQIKLTHDLEVEYMKRQAVRLRMGEERWIRNPNRNINRAKERERRQRQLREICYALYSLSKVDTINLRQTTHLLKKRVEQEILLRNKKRCTKDKENRKLQTKDSLLGFNAEDIMILYPSPRLFDWVFTGQQDRPEGAIHFEKNGILLDWYHLTGTLELSFKNFSPTGDTTFYKSVEAVDPTFYLALLQSSDPWRIVQHKQSQILRDQILL